MITLYDYYRSSACFRVRICLNLKKIAYTSKEIHLLKNGGQQNGEYLNINEQGLVPTLEWKDGTLIKQSLNIIEFIDTQEPEPSIIPNTIPQQLLAKQIAYAICCDIHPLNNLRVLNYITKTLKCEDDEKQNWYRHWIMEGFYAIEQWLKDVNTNTTFCVSNELSIADICLIPQVYNAERYNISLNNYPIIKRIYEECLKVPAVIQAHPDNCK